MSRGNKTKANGKSLSHLWDRYATLAGPRSSSSQSPSSFACPSTSCARSSQAQGQKQSLSTPAPHPVGQTSTFRKLPYPRPLWKVESHDPARTHPDHPDNDFTRSMPYRSAEREKEMMYHGKNVLDVPGPKPNTSARSTYWSDVTPRFRKAPGSVGSGSGGAGDSRGGRKGRRPSF